MNRFPVDKAQRRDTAAAPGLSPGSRSTMRGCRHKMECMASRLIITAVRRIASVCTEIP